MNSRFWRALLAFLACPGVVALGIPAVWVLASDAVAMVHPLGSIPLAAGFVALLWCVVDFYRAGKGTLAPWDPPKTLVTLGLYRHSRNPMYVAVSLVLLGWAIGFASPGLLAYAGVVMLVFHLRVVLGEEPWLARTFGAQWEQYQRKVPRWLW